MIDDIKLIDTMKENHDAIIEKILWLKAQLIENGICPDCGNPETTSSKDGLLWCPNCDAHYDYTKEIAKINRQKEIAKND